MNAVHDSHASTFGFVQVDIACANCGDGVGCEVPAPAAPDLLVFCDDCRAGLLDKPSLPAGYDLLRELGRGGMGAVYLVQHRALGLQRALKVILPQGAVSESARALFLQEARIHASLCHPRIVQVHDLSEVKPGVFAIVMEYVPGPNAGELLARRDPTGLDAATAVAIACQALEALAYVHAQGVIHCDVKDPNLLVLESPALSVKLSDFGLARTYAASGASSRKRADVTSGTIAYMSPEQASCRPLLPESDLFSLGATLYRLLTGSCAHDFPENCDRLEVVRHERAVPIRQRRPSVAEPLAAVVDRSLAPDPKDRFPSAEGMRRALTDAVVGS